MIELIGAIHMHSVFSDGSGEVEEIARYAEEANLDYIILTDHNTLRALKEGYEGWYNNTLLLVGCEINDKHNENHYIALGINVAFSTRMSSKEYVKKVKDAGGIGFIAHPFEKRKHMIEHPPYPWTDWDSEDFTGIEIWNHMSEWMENLTEENKYQAFIHPLRSIISPTKETLKKWDDLNIKRKVVGIGGIDAHAHKHNVLGFVEVEVFPYKVLFKSIRTHILIDEELPHNNDDNSMIKTKGIIYAALKSGNCFFANDYRADSKGFRFFAEAGKNKYGMGELVDNSGKVKLIVSVPAQNAEIRLICNGELVESEVGTYAKFTADKPGAYRVEIYHNKKAWIYSNHIRINI